MALRVGILMGRTQATGVLMRTRRFGRVRRLAEARCALDAAVWSAAEPDFSRPFRDLARQLGAVALRADAAATIGLPDPVINEDIVSFREVPETEAEIDALIRWRAARDYRKEETEIACAWQEIGETAAGRDFLVRMMPRETVAALTRDAARAGFSVAAVEGYSRFAMPPSPGARLTVEVTDAGEWWCVSCQDGAGGRSHVQSDWLEPPEAGAAAARIQRLVKSYLLTYDGREAVLSVAAGPDLAQALTPDLLADGTAPRPEILQSERLPVVKAAERVAVAAL